MLTAFDDLQRRAADDWLVGYDNRALVALAEQAWEELQWLQEQGRSPTHFPLRIILAERDPVRFLAYFIAAASIDCHLFLANPDWAEAEWAEALALAQPDVLWGSAGTTSLISLPPPTLSPPLPHPLPHSLILIPTGGSSGTIRFAMHTWETLIASVKGFQQFFGVDQINSFCVLPLYHVSGLMQFMRSFTSGGKLFVQPFKVFEKALAVGDRLPINPADHFLSLVPTQLHRLLPPSPPPPLPLFPTILLGGAPAWAELLATARQHGIRLAPTYGMTETASQIATLKPENFLAGLTGYAVLPHAQVTIGDASRRAGDRPPTGILSIQATSLALGYYPDRFEQQEFQPDDLGFLDERGDLHIVGRQSDKIITGGENVFPAAVEAAIRATGLVQDVCVVGVNDRHWGQVVTAIYVPQNPALEPTFTTAILKRAIEPKLSKCQRPKHWISLEQLPRNAQDKVNRAQLLSRVLSRVQAHHPSGPTNP